MLLPFGLRAPGRNKGQKALLGLSGPLVVM